MAFMHIARRNLISLSLKHHPNPWSLCKTHLSPSFSSTAAADEKGVSIAEHLQQRHQFSPDAVSKLVSSGKDLGNPENCDSVLSFFKETGFSTTHLQKMVRRYPKVLTASVDLTIKPKVKLLQDSGLSPAEIADIVAAIPWILYRHVDPLGLTISELKRILGPSLNLCSFFKNSNSTRFMTPNLILNLELLLSCGISASQMASVIHHSSRFICQEHEHIKKTIERVEEMGCDRSSKMFVHAIRVVSSRSMEVWERKWEVFRSLGFSEDEIRSAFRRTPQVFSVSESKIKESTKALLNATNGDISLVVDHPHWLIFSVEKTLKPRLRVLEVLERKNLLVKKPRLTTFLSLTNEEFLRKFVLPYLAEVGAVFKPRKGLVKA